MKNNKIENVFSLKEKFAHLLQFYIKRSHVSQADLARLFNVTPSAICQMIKCSILFDLEQMNIIAKAIKLKDEELFELTNMLYKLNNGALLHSPFNKLLKKLRKEKKYSIADLSVASQIPRRRLNELEENFETTIHIDEATTLANIYDYSLRDLLKCAKNGMHQIIDPEDDDNTLGESVQIVQENKIPLMPLKELRYHNSNIGFQALIESKNYNHYEYLSEKEVIAIEADNEFLELPFNGTTIIIAREYHPEDPSAKVFIGMDKKENYYVFSSDTFGNFNHFFTGEYSLKAPNLKWQMTVEEIIIKPQEM